MASRRPRGRTACTAVIEGKEPLVTIVFVIALVALTGLYFVFSARKRAERRAVEAAIARRAARRNRVPAVSNNVRGVTASQTMEPFKPSDSADDRNQRAA